MSSDRAFLRVVELDVKPTVGELARAFAAMFDDEQAEFFNHVALLFEEMGDGKGIYQRDMIGLHEKLSPTAARWIEGLHIAAQERSK